MKKRAAAAGSLLSLVAVLGACGGDDGSEATGSRGDACAEDDVELENVVDLEGAAARVEAKDNSLVEENIRVAAGTTVTWENKGRADHNIKPASDDCDDWGVELGDFAPGDTYEHTFDEPGTYRYYCEPHGTPDAGMIGAVVVE